MIDHSSLVLSRCKKALNDKFGENAVYVSSIIADTPSEFPAASIRQLGAPAVASSFSSRQCACISTIEVQAYSTMSATEAKRIIATIADKMDEMNYALIYGPEDVTNKADVRKFVARFRRTIGAGDNV